MKTSKTKLSDDVSELKYRLEVQTELMALLTSSLEIVYKHIRFDSPHTARAIQTVLLHTKDVANTVELNIGAGGEI